MRTRLKPLLSVVAVSLAASAAPHGALGAEACPNDQLRVENRSAGLPDCRAYELVSPDSNLSKVNTYALTRALPDGNTLLYSTVDAPDEALSSQPLGNPIVATRDPVSGWSGISMEPPLVGPVNKYLGSSILAVSGDLTATLVGSSQPLSGGAVPGGTNLYVSKPGGGYSLLTLGEASKADFGGSVMETSDFSHVYFYYSKSLSPTDPPAGLDNLYSWTEGTGSRLVSTLPDGTPAPTGGRAMSGIIGSMSEDGERLLFLSEGTLYLHIEGAPSVEVAPITYDPQSPPASSDLAGLTSDGTTVLFTSHAELTPDANTGAEHLTRNLYGFDVATGHMTDLTVDNAPADAATGADVRRVLASTADGAYIYFTAAGHLAAGAPYGHTSLYVWHEGRIEFLADADGQFAEAVAPFYVTPDGQHSLFESTLSLTGYDNDDPLTGHPHAEVFEDTLGEAIVCVSCRANGTRPTGDSTIQMEEGKPVTLTEKLGHVLSDDGRRAFFDSTDVVVPGASSGREQVFEYEDGHPSLISVAGSSSDAIFLDASASGDDVFFESFEDLVPNPNSGYDAVFDARVDGGFPVPTDNHCSGSACQPAATLPPNLMPPASTTFSGPGNPPPALLVAHAPTKKGAIKCRKGHVKKKRRCVKANAKRNSAKKGQATIKRGTRG